MQSEQTSKDLATVVETIWQQQLDSFDNGSLIPAEEFLQQHPELLSAPEAAVDVIFNEYELLSRDNSDSKEPEAFIARFPEFQQALSKQFELLDAFDSADLHLTVQDSSNGEYTHGENGNQECNLELSRFRERKIIGQGATATVEFAFDEKLQHHVALKRLHAHLQNSNRAIQRLRREAQTVARLHHPNIVPIYEILDEGGQLVLVSRFVDGTNLRDLSEGAGISNITQVIQWVRQIAEALHYSHSNDVTHRDVKPSNIIVDKDGNAMLTDFGLASYSQSGGAITQTGEMLGTPAFMSPEQALGDPDAVDHRTDIYSLGATLYFLLAGRAPFAGTFANVVQNVVARQAPSLKSLGVSVPADLATITSKCLSKSPMDRYASAREFADDLQRFSNGEVIQARTAGPLERLAKLVRRRPVLSGAIASTLLLSAFLLGALLQLGEIRDQRNRAQDAEQANRELLASASVDAGMLSMRQGDPDRAIVLFQNSLEQGVDDPANVHLLLVEATMSKGDVDLASEYLSWAAAFENPQHLPLVKYWETELAAFGHAQHQTKSIDEVAFAKLGLSKQHFFLGFNATTTIEALDHFRKAVLSDPTHRSARRMSLVMALSLARFEEVLVGSEIARQMYPDDIDFQLIETLAHSCTNEIRQAKLSVDRLPIPPDEKQQWSAFCEFLAEATNDDYLGKVTNDMLPRIVELLSRFNTQYLPLLEARRWRFPPKIAEKFGQLSGQNFSSIEEDGWLKQSHELADVHPEATLLVIAGETELLSNNPLAQLQQAQEYFLTATQSPAFMRNSHDSAWMGVYATSMSIYMVHKNDIESNRQLMIDSIEHIDPKWLSGHSKLRSMYIPLITIGEWDHAKRFIDRAVEIAKDDVFKSDCLWHLALWYKQRQDWSQVLKVCQKREAEISTDYQNASPYNWLGLQNKAIREMKTLLED